MVIRPCNESCTTVSDHQDTQKADFRVPDDAAVYGYTKDNSNEQDDRHDEHAGHHTDFHQDIDHVIYRF